MRLLIGTLVALALVGCGGAGSDGTDGLSTLVAVTTEVAGSNCAAGGSRIGAGPDANANGVLDASEVSSIQFVCNGATGAAGVDGASGSTGATGPAGPAGSTGATGATGATGPAGPAGPTGPTGATGSTGATGLAGSDGLSTLVKLTAESAGSNCANGGTMITAGMDTNRNGALDALEVVSTSYVCGGANGTNGTNGINGSNGTSGTNGLNSLLAIVPESAGANCTYGGSKVTAGIDTNINAVLDATEVTSTSYNCNGAPGAGITWVDVTTTSAQAVVNTGYLANNPAQVVVNLPTAPAVGDLVQVSGVGAGGWKISQNAGQSM